jgi:hypothetical protein
MADPNVPGKAKFPTSVVSAFFGALAGIIGAIGTYLIAMHNADDSYRLQFASTIRESAAALSTSESAATTYAGLYALARPNDEDYKRILMVIGYTTNVPSVKTVLTAFIHADNDMKELAQKPDMVELLQQASTVAATVESTTAQSAAAPKSASAAAAVQARVVPDAGQVALLRATPPQQTTGWIYYGRVGRPGDSQLGECIDPRAPVPTNGKSVTLCASRYVRDAPTATTGKVLSALSAGAQATVTGERSYDIAQGAKAVWLQVALPK